MLEVNSARGKKAGEIRRHRPEVNPALVRARMLDRQIYRVQRVTLKFPRSFGDAALLRATTIQNIAEAWMPEMPIGCYRSTDATSSRIDFGSPYTASTFVGAARFEIQASVMVTGILPKMSGTKLPLTRTFNISV